MGGRQEIYKVIQDRLAPMRDRVKESEEDLMAFRERDTEMLFADEDQNVISEQIENSDDRLCFESKAERIRLETRLNAVNDLSAVDLAETSFPAVLNDATIQGLLQQKADLEVELTDKLRQHEGGSPAGAAVALVDRRDYGRIFEQIQTIKTSAKTEYDMVRRRERRCTPTSNSSRGRPSACPSRPWNTASLEEEYRQNKTFLDDMMARSKEADISQTTAVNNISVIEPARSPGGPFKPNPKRAAILSAIMGLLSGCGSGVHPRLSRSHLAHPGTGGGLPGFGVLTVLPKFTGGRGTGHARGLPNFAHRCHSGGSRQRQPCHAGHVGSAVRRQDDGGLERGQGVGHRWPEGAVD